MTQTPHKRTFGTKLSSNTPLPHRYTPKQKTPKSIAGEFVDSSVGIAVDRVCSRDKDDRTTPEARSGEAKWTPVSKLAFSSPDFKIYRGTPSSSSSSSSPANTSVLSDGEEKHWSKRAVTAAHQPDGSFLYSTLHATSPSQPKSWARVAAESSLNSIPTASSQTYPTQQLRRPKESPLPTIPQTVNSPPFPSPDSTASVAPTPFYSRHVPKEQEIASPTGSIISTSSSVARREVALQTIELGPAEYGIVFPPGPLPLKFEGVICTGNTPIGGCISEILPGYNPSICRSMSSTKGIEPTLQKNDLLISLNSISLQSRPYPAIISLLKQYEQYEKTLVFRSLDKVWKSTFQPKTMRNLRSGKRVATALDVKSMDRELWSWVETPTKVEPVTRTKKRERKKENVIVEEESATPAKHSNFDSIFSPSNVKKLSRATPSPLKNVNSEAHEASTAKKKNFQKSPAVAVSATPGKKRLQQICRVLIGEDNGTDKDLERVVILKKEVLKELESVRIALMKEREEEIQNTVTVDQSLNPIMPEKEHVEMKKIEVPDETFNSFMPGKKEEEDVTKESKSVAEMQQKLYQAYEAIQRSEEEHHATLSQKEEESATLQSKYETEMAKLRAELRVASEKSLEKEQKSIIVQTDLEEERSKTQAIRSMLDETQRSNVRQEKLITSLEEEADRKQRLIEESEAASDLKSEELHRLRKLIAELESKQKSRCKTVEQGTSAQKSTEREGILLKMVEQQRVDFEKREELLESQVQDAKHQLENEKAVHAEEISAMKTQLDATVKDLNEANSILYEHQAKTSQRIVNLEIERDNALEKLEEANAHYSDRVESLVRENEEYQAQRSSISEQLELQYSKQIEQDELINRLQEEVQSQRAANSDQHSLIDELKAEKQSLTESVQEQRVVKVILAENLSKHIAASEGGLVKLDELNNIIESKLEDFSVRIAKSESFCRAANNSFKLKEAEKDYTLQSNESDTLELEKKIVEVAAELQNSLVREKNMALRLDAERAQFISRETALENALTTCKQVQAKNDELSALIDSVQAKSSQRISELEAERKNAILDLNLKIDNRDNQVICIQDQLDAKHAEVRQLISQIQTLELEASESSVFSKEREANLRQSHVELSNLNAEKLQLQAKLEAERNERFSSECLLRSEIRRLKDNLTGMFDKNKKLQFENEMISSDLDENKQSLSRNREEFVAILEQKDNTIAQKQKIIHSMSDELSLLHDEIVSANAELMCSKQYAIEIESSHNIKLASLRLSHAKLHESCSSLQQENSSLKKKCAHMSGNLKSALSSLEDKESEIDKMRVKITDLSVNIQAVKKERNLLRGSLIDTENEMATKSASLREQLQVKERQIIDLESKMNKLVSEMSLLELELNSASEKIQVMCSEHENEIEATQFEATEDLLDKAETQIHSLSNDCKCLKSKVASAIDERDNLKATLDCEVEALNCENKELTRELQICKDHALKLESEKNQLVGTVSTLKLSLADADSSHGELCSNIGDLRQEMAQMIVINEGLSGTIEDLTIQLNQAKRDIKTLESIKSEHLEEISLLESSKDMLVNQINYLECKSLTDCNIFKGDRQELSETIKGKNAQITALATQKDVLMATVEMLQVKVTTLTTEKNELEVNINDCFSQLEQLKLEPQNTLDVEQETHYSRQSKQEGKTTLKTTLEEIKQKHEANMDSLRCQLLQSLDAREQDAAEARKLQLELENKVDEQSDIIFVKDKDSLSMRTHVTNLEQIIDDLKAQIKNLEIREISLQESIKGEEEVVFDLSSKQDELKLVTESLSEQHQVEKERLVQSLNDQETQIADLTSQNLELEISIANYKESLQLHRETSNVQSNKIEGLTKALKAAEQKISEETEQFESNQAALSKLVNEKDETISDLSASIVKLEDTIGNLQAEMKQLENELHHKEQSFESELLKRHTAEQVLKSSVQEDKKQALRLDYKANLSKEAYESERRQALRDTTNLHNSIAAEKIKYQHLTENLEATRAALSLKESEFRAILADKEVLKLETIQKEAEFDATAKKLRHKIELEKATSSELSCRLNQLTSSLAFKEKEIENLKATFISSKSSLESKLLESEQNIFRYQQSSIETESQLTAKIESLTEELNTARKTEKDAREELVLVRDELGITMKSKSSIEQERDILSYDLSNTANQLSIVEEKLQSCHEQLLVETTSREQDQNNKEVLRLKLQEAMSWSDLLRAEVTKKEKCLGKKENELRDAINLSESLRTEIAKQNKLLSEKGKEIAVLSTEVQSVKLSYEEAVTKHQSFIELLKSNSKQELSALRFELAQETNAHRTDLEKLDELHLKLKEAVDWSDSYKNNLEENQTLLKEKESHIDFLESSIKSHKNELSSVHDDLKASQEELAVTKISYREEFSKTSMELAEKEKKITSLQHELQEVKCSSQEAIERALSDLMITAGAKDDTIEKLNMHLEDATKKFSSLNAVMDEKETALASLHCELDSVKSSFRSLQEELEDEHNLRQECSRKNQLLGSELQEALDKNEQLCSDVEARDRNISSLCSMLHRTHLDICQLSMELSCTKSASILCFASVKKDMESAVNDLTRYYEAKEQNYRSIINELNHSVSEHQVKQSHDDSKSIRMNEEVSVLSQFQSSQCLDRIQYSNIKIAQQSETIERLVAELAVVNDELISLRAEVKCSKEIEASFHADHILLHRTISNILNSPCAPIGNEDAIELSMHPYERFLNFVEIELRDLSFLYNVDITGAERMAPKPELINAILQTMKMSARNTSPQRIDLDTTSDSQQIKDFLSDINLAQNKVIDMNEHMECTSRSRDECEKLLIIEQKRAKSLENTISSVSVELDSKSKVLTQTEEQYRKLQAKHENATAEIDQCQKLALELKRIIIEKNSEIQSKQNQLFELQFRLDDVTSRSDGLDASLEGVESVQDNSIVVDISMARHDELAEEVARLESKILQKDQDAAQLSSMHKAIVDGLEDECRRLVDEIDEAKRYISALEDTHSRLAEDVERQRLACEAKGRMNKDLESALHILQEQKIQIEEDNQHISAEVSKLAVAVASCASLIEGFSFNEQCPASCCGNLQYIGLFIQYLLASRESMALSDIITPKTRGRGGFSERSDIIVELEEMKGTLTDVLSSPRLTSVKQTDDKTDEHDLYHDLVHAVEQLEQLSQNFRNCQEQWKDKESQLTLRINHLERSSHVQIVNLKLEQEWRQRLTATVIENLQRRRHCNVLRRAFQTWAFQTRWRKHLDIVKDMAKELLQTRQKVLLLKSQFTGNAI